MIFAASHFFTIPIHLIVISMSLHRRPNKRDVSSSLINLAMNWNIGTIWNISYSNHKALRFNSKSLQWQHKEEGEALRGTRTASQSVSQSVAAAPECWFVQGKLRRYLIYCKATHGSIQEHAWMKAAALLATSRCPQRAVAELSAHFFKSFATQTRGGMGMNEKDVFFFN